MSFSSDCLCRGLINTREPSVFLCWAFLLMVYVIGDSTCQSGFWKSSHVSVSPLKVSRTLNSRSLWVWAGPRIRTCPLCPLLYLWMGRRGAGCCNTWISLQASNKSHKEISYRNFRIAWNRIKKNSAAFAPSWVLTRARLGGGRRGPCPSGKSMSSSCCIHITRREVFVPKLPSAFPL